MAEGFFGLDTPADLLAKLGREFGRMRGHPNDVDHAFNFFVTADHVLDWLHPQHRAARRALRASSPLLETVWDLANGAKHFRLRPSHVSVKSSQAVDEKAAPWFEIGDDGGATWAPLPPKVLVVFLDGRAATELGPEIGALALAERVYAYWSAPGRVQS